MRTSLRSRRIRLLAGALAAAAAVLAALVHAPPVRSRVLGMLVSRIAAAGLVVRADALDYNLFTLTIRLSGVSLATPGAAATPFLTAKEVRASLPWAVVAGRPAIDHLEIVSPRVTLHRDGLGRDNWTFNPREESSGAPTALHVGRVIVSHLALDWTDDQQSAHADADFTLDMAFDGHATVGPIVMPRPAIVRWRDRTTSIAADGGRLSWNDGDLAVDALSLRAAEGVLRLDGRIDELIGAARLDARVDVDVNLEHASPWAGFERAIAGSAKGSVHMTPAGVELTSLHARLAHGTIDATAHASFDGAGATHLAWSDLDLPELLRRVLADPPRVLPSARASGSLDAEWTRATLDGLKLTANSRLDGAPAGQRSDPPVDAAMAFELRGGAWKLSAERVDALGSRGAAALEGTLDSSDLLRSTIGGRLHAGTIDDREWAHALVRAGWLPALPPVRAAGSADFLVGGTIGAPSIDGDVDATVQYESMPAASVRARASLTREAIALDNIDARMAGGAARGALRWTIGSDAIDGAVNGSLPLNDLRLAAPSIPRSFGLDGTVNVEAAVSGSIAEPRIAMTATGGPLDIAGQTLDRAAADVRVAGADVIVDRVLLEQAAGRLDAGGSLNLSRNTYSAHVTVTDMALHPMVGVNGDVEAAPVSGRLSGTFEGRGTLEDPGGRGHVTIAGARWRSVDAGTINTDITLGGHRATFTFDARDVDVTGHGAIGFDPAGPVSVSAAWEPGDIAAFSARLGLEVPVSGSAALAAEWNGTRDRLDEGRGWLRIDRADLGVASQRFRLAQPGRIDADTAGAIRVTPIVLTAGASKITLAGALGDAGTSGRLALTLDGALADFAFLRDLMQPEAAGAPERRLPSGAIHAELAADGAPMRPRISAAFRIDDGRVPVAGGRDVTGVRIAARYDQGVVTLERMTAGFEGASLSATARVPSAVFADRLPPSIRSYVPAVAGPATLSARIADITPSVAAPFADAATLQQIGLRADAAIDLESDALTAEAVRGSLVLSRADVSLAGVSIDQQVPTRLLVRDGRVTIDAFRWGRENNQVVLEGGLTLAAEPVVDVSAKAVIDLQMLNALTPAVRTAGRGDAEVRVRGALRAPDVDGYLTLSGGEARVADPRMVVGDLSGTITFTGDTLTLERLSATINGGAAELAGSIRHRALAPVDGSLTLTATGAALDVAGLRAEADAALAWTIDANGAALGGSVTLLRSGFRERLSVTGSLLSAVRGSSPAAVRPPGVSVLDRTRLDVRLLTDEDLLIDNNLARLGVRADLRAVGTVSRPSLTGRAALGEGGVLVFNGTRYRLSGEGSIDFANPARIEPDLDLAAVARVQGNEITLALKGTPATLEATLDSDNKSLSQSDLVSLLLIGRTTSGTEGAAAGSDELVGLLAGGFLDAAGRAIGLDTARVERGSPDVRFDAGLVASETDPGARFTFGKSIGVHWDVVFSQSLQQSGGLTWIVGYKPHPGIDVRVISLDEGDRLYTFSHDITIGGPTRTASAAASPPPRVSTVVVTGAGADEPALRSRLTLRSGDEFSFFRWQDDRERLETFYEQRRRLEARVVARREAEPSGTGRVRLAYDVRPGPQSAVAVDGFPPSRSAAAAIDHAWARSVADEFLIEEAIDIMRADLAAAGYPLPVVTARMEHGADSKLLRVAIAPGQRVRGRRVEFSGNAGQSSAQLLKAIADRGLTSAVWTTPDAVRDALTEFYRSNGWLNAAIRIEPVAVTDGTAVRTIRVDEGGAFRVASVRVDGLHAIAHDEAARIIGLAAGDRYTESRLDAGQLALDAQYRTRGYNRVGIDYEARRADAAPDAFAVDIIVRVEEGPQQRLRDVVTSGLSRTRPAILSRALTLDVGAPVDLAAWNAARRRVYETGAFRSVDIQRTVIEESAPAGGEEPVRATVTVQEWPPLRIRYGIEVRDQLAAAGDAARANAPETGQTGGRTFGLGLAGDLATRGLFGTTISAGVAGRYAPGTRASRAYMTSPSFFGRAITSTVFVERSLEDVGSTPLTGLAVFETQKTSLTLEQRIRLAHKTTISYLYTFERNHTQELDPDPFDPLPFDLTITIGRFASTVVFDRRNDLTDPSRGWFHSSNAQYAPAALGSDLRFLKYFVQQHYFRTIGPVVFASAARLGLATAFDQTLTPDQRFFAGGGNSVRGYDEDVLSPFDASGGAIGGNALAVFNEELRFPIFRIVRGVGFFDAGRAFERVSDLSLGALATSGGFGVRVQTPFVLLRVDAGVPFDAAFGRRTVRWFFSIGQLF
jgi:outer membrane protein assembly factor BamA/autotransporter translocation and assembly factor TamB